MIVSIDPGLRGCGVATWSDSGELRWAGYVPSFERAGRGAGAWRSIADAVVARRGTLGFSLDWALTALCVESQQVYSKGRAARAAARSGDLREVTGVAATLCALIPATTYLQPLPFDWKRNKEKKAKCAEIARAVASKGWTDRVQLPRAAKLQLDVWDAVGIGLWAHARLRVTGTRLPSVVDQIPSPVTKNVTR